MRHGGLLAGAAALVLLALVPAADAAFPGTNGKILYTTNEYSPKHIRMVCPDGSNNRLVKSNAYYATPSPDGTKMVYNGMFDRPASERGVWVSNIDGSNPIRIVDDVKSPHHPSWSPDGTKIVWSQYYNFNGEPTARQTLVTAPANGSGSPTPLFPDDNWHVNSAISWTADNQWIIFTASIDAQGHDLYKIPSNGGVPTRLFGDNETWFFQSAATHPNSSRIMVHKDHIQNMTSENWEYTLSGSGTFVSHGVDDSDDQTSGDEWIDWSPDGAKTVMVRTVAKLDHRIAIGDADAKNVTHMSHRGTYPRWINGSTADCSTPYNPTFDKVRINEVGLSAGGSTSNRFVELAIGADQDFPAANGPYRVLAYDAAGTRLGGHNISSSMLQNHDPLVPFLMSTSGANTHHGVTGHFGLGMALPANGQLCFTTGSAETKQSCLGWGCIASPVQAGMPRVAAPGDGMSAQRQGVLSTAFQVAAPTPKAANVAGVAPKPCPSDPDPDAGGGDQTGGGGAGGGAGGSGGGGGTPTPPSVFSGPPLPAPGSSSSTGPRASLSAPGTVKVEGGAVTVTVACAAGGPGCAGKAVLQTAGARAAAAGAAKPARLGAASVRVAAGKRAKVKVRLSASGRKLVRRKKRVKAQLVVTLTGAKPVTRSLTIRG